MENPTTGIPAPDFTFEPVKCTAVLPLPLDAFLNEAAEAAVARLGLHEKDEVHLTVMGSDAGAALIEKLGEGAGAAAVKLLEAYRDRWAIVPVQKFYYLEKSKELDGQPYHRQTLIQECAAPALAEFYADLSALVGRELPVPYPHVTLGSNSNIEQYRLRGIGVASRAELEEMDVVREVTV